jgi:UDP-N-acetylmuramate--alanine ligase
MMSLIQANHIHFSGIKGVGMTALALYALDMGIKVTGSDIDEEFVTDDILSARKIEISKGLSRQNLPTTAQALIYSAAWPNNPQVKKAKETGLTVVNYAEALREFIREKEVIAVSGVGGKTTTTAMIATILNAAQMNPSFINGVGNIPNLGVPGKYTKGKHVVVEADEYVAVPMIDNTPKFLYLNPKILVVTNIEFDHPDVYKNLRETMAAFKSFFLRLAKDGHLIANIDNKNIQIILNELSESRPDINVITYGFSPQADWRIKKVRATKKTLSCLVEVRGVRLDYSLLIPGKHNAANACAALVAATQLGVSQRIASKAFLDFQGTKRRFEKIGWFKGNQVWDDYAHHPSEIRATLMAAKEWFKNKRLIAIFQPHTYSRTKSLLNEFARSLSLADEIIITEIYSSAREKKDPTISGKILSQKTQGYSNNVQYIPSNDLLEYMRKSKAKGEIIMTLGAGDIYKVAEDLVKQNET